MEPRELEEHIDELETRVERLRALYEQYFMGIEKMEPQIPRKDVERRIWVLRRVQIRNTGMRFKFQTLVQRYNTFQQYWQRTTREIENGTYRRDVMRAAKRFGTKAALTIVGRKRQENYKKLAEAQEERDGVKQDAGASAVAEVEVDIDTSFESEAPPPPPPPLEFDLDTRRPPPKRSTTPARNRAAGRKSSGRMRAVKMPGAPGMPANLAAPPAEATAPAAPPAAAPAQRPMGSLLGRPAARPPLPGGPPLRPGVPPAPPAPNPASPAAAAGTPAARPEGAPPAKPLPPPLRGAQPRPPGDVVSPAPPGAPPPPAGARPAPPAAAAAKPPARRRSSATMRAVQQPVERAASPRAPAPAPAPAPPTPAQQPVAARAPAAQPAQQPAAAARAPVAQPAQQPVAAARAPAAQSPADAAARAARAPAARPAPAAAAATPRAPTATGDEALHDIRLRQIYAKYVETKRSVNESTANVTYERLANSLRSQADKLRAAHPNRRVDYEVIVKDGKTLLKPILR